MTGARTSAVFVSIYRNEVAIVLSSSESIRIVDTSPHCVVRVGLFLSVYSSSLKRSRSKRRLSLQSLIVGHEVACTRIRNCQNASSAAVYNILLCGSNCLDVILKSREVLSLKEELLWRRKKKRVWSSRIFSRELMWSGVSH